MRDPARIDEFCEVLKEKWKEVPDWRFGQFMCNFLGEVSACVKADVFYVEDDTMENFLKEYLR